MAVRFPFEEATPANLLNDVGNAEKRRVFQKVWHENMFSQSRQRDYHFGLAVLHLKLSDLLLTADLCETIIALR